MTANEAKKDAAKRLTAAGVTYAKLSARTVSMTDLARAAPVFVTVHGGVLPARVTYDSITADIPKPSLGGYVLRWSNR